MSEKNNKTTEEVEETLDESTQTNSENEKETAAEETAEKTDAEKLADAEAQIAQLNDQMLRLRAEFDNYRKRTLKEKAEIILNGGQTVMTSLLPVLDDLDRAMENIEKSNEVDTLKEGVELIISKLSKTLGGQGLKKMETIGQLFDTDFHEAIALVPSPDEAQKGHIIDCVTPGYTLNDKVIRHAKVVVGQ